LPNEHLIRQFANRIWILPKVTLDALKTRRLFWSGRLNRRKNDRFKFDRQLPLAMLYKFDITLWCEGGQ